MTDRLSFCSGQNKVAVITRWPTACSTCSNSCFSVLNARAVFKYDGKSIVHIASGTDYEEFRSHFVGWYIYYYQKHPLLLLPRDDVLREGFPPYFKLFSIFQS